MIDPTTVCKRCGTTDARHRENCSEVIFQKMFKSLPKDICLDGCEKTAEDLIFAVESQLQLCEEGQDGTEEDDQKAMRRWLKKWTGNPRGSL